MEGKPTESAPLKKHVRFKHIEEYSEECKEELKASEETEEEGKPVANGGRVCIDRKGNKHWACSNDCGHCYACSKLEKQQANEQTADPNSFAGERNENSHKIHNKKKKLKKNREERRKTKSERRRERHKSRLMQAYDAFSSHSLPGMRAMTYDPGGRGLSDDYRAYSGYGSELTGSYENNHQQRPGFFSRIHRQLRSAFYFIYQILNSYEDVGL